MPQEKSVGAIIYRIQDGERLYLLLKYKAKHWDFVKGHIDEGETDMQTLFRETEEESGIKDLKVQDGFKEYAKFVFKQYKELMTEEQVKIGKPIWVFKIVTFYLAETKIKDVVISAEHQDYKWLPYEDAIEQTTFKGSKEILKKANDFIEKSNL